MPIPSVVTDLSATPSLNSPAGTDNIGTSLDDYLRSHAAIIRQVYDTQATVIDDVIAAGDAAVAEAVAAGDAAIASVSAIVATATTVGEGSLTQYFLPTLDGNFRDMYRSGWLPSWFNQQWGGSQWGTLPDGSFGSVATGNVEDDNSLGIDQGAGSIYGGSGFKVSEVITNPSVWVKLYKVGNPTSALTVSIYSDTGSGVPNALVGSSSTIASKLVSSKADGEWYSVNIAATLSADTQYHVVLWTKDAVDASNYYLWKCTTSKKYPHGIYYQATSAPSWSLVSGVSACFLIQNPTANSLIQSGGQFDHKLSFALGSPVNQSRAVAQPLVNFYDGKNCSVLYRGTYSASTNVWEFCYGIDHDRIVVGIDASGYPYVRLFESDTTVHTVSHNVSVTTGFHDIGVRVRTVGDGADYLTLYVDGVSVGTPITAATFTMANEMRQLGTARLGECFTHLPTWTGNAMTDTAQLPSNVANGTWTYTTNGSTESADFSMQGGKLYQNANAHTTNTWTGYYAKTVAMVNATGWTVSARLRIPSVGNNTNTGGCVIAVLDGSKQVSIYLHEYFLETINLATNFVVQGDFKSQDHVFTLCGKGSDFYLFIDGKLAIDGTGGMTSATATNAVRFGDIDNDSTANADAIWSYLKYSTAGMMLPTAGSNTCSEFAHWSGDKSSLFPSLYNSGTPVSVKQLCGVPRNYQFEQVVQREVRNAVTSLPTTTSGTDVIHPEMEAYVIGSVIDIEHNGLLYTGSASSQSYTRTYVDGAIQADSYKRTDHSSASQLYGHHYAITKTLPLGLHKVEGKYRSDTVVTVYSHNRTLLLGVKS